MVLPWEVYLGRRNLVRKVHGGNRIEKERAKIECCPRYGGWPLTFDVALVLNDANQSYTSHDTKQIKFH